MTALLLLLHLGGAVALLLWATRMVRTGVERAYGHLLKARLRQTLRNPFYATAFGGLMAIMLQSSTAVVLLVSSFVGSGFVSAAAGLMAVRGGELGSALLVKILILDLNALVPILLLCGTALFLTTKRREWRQIGRISIGIALLLISLEMTREATSPLQDSAALPAIIAYLSGDMVSSFLIVALLTYLFHSSIAGIILVASFAHHGLIGEHLALIMVLGVNFGSSIITPLLTRHAPSSQRIVPLGNLLMRGVGSLALLGYLSFFSLPVDFLGSSSSDIVVNGHIVFNVAILFFGMIFAKPALMIVQGFVAFTSGEREEEGPHYPFPPTALDKNVFDKPNLALASAGREIIRLSDIVDALLEKTIAFYETPTRDVATEIATMAAILDRRQEDFSRYLTKVGAGQLDDGSLARSRYLLDTGSKLQQAGHIIGRALMEAAKPLVNGKASLPREEVAALNGFCRHVLANARLGFYLLVSSDVATAEQLVREKDNLREVEKSLRHRHFERLQSGSSSDIHASTLYLDCLNDLKQVNALLTTLAYPILEAEGQLKQSRLDIPV